MREEETKVEKPDISSIYGVVPWRNVLGRKELPEKEERDEVVLGTG